MIVHSLLLTLNPSIPVFHMIWVHKLSLTGCFDADFIADGLRIILENNIFKFDDVFYRQLMGTTMGTKVAVIYAILCTVFYRTQAI